MQLHVRDPQQPLQGDLLVPSSKYHAHRALILASLAPGTSRIVGLSDARHVKHTISLLRGLGTRIDLEADGFLVHGGPYAPRQAQVSAGSSGTTLYFMIGLAALSASPVTIVGQKYFQRRPVGPLLASLRELGVRVQSEHDRPPIAVTPGRPAGGRVRVPGTLSQWISGLLLLAPFATGPTVIEVEGELNEQPYLALTVAMMRRFGLEVDVAPDWRRFAVEPGQAARPATVVLPPDVGSAAFALAAAALHPADVRLRGFATGEDLDHPEAHALEVMRAMGVPLEADAEGGAVRIRHDGMRLRGVDVDCREMPDMLPILSVLGAFAKGTTRFVNVEHVRLKESDRVAAMLQLGRMGARVEMDGEDLVCRGVERLRGAPLSSYNDHRVLMALAVAATRADGESTLTYPNAYRISYPSFLDDMTKLGLPMEVREGRAPERPEPRESVAIDRAVQTPITEQVRRWAAERPDDLAVVDVAERSGGERAARDRGDERTWSWRELAEAVDRAAALLLELGVQPGEAVAFQLPNVGEFPVLALAILRVGAVCCPLMPIFREREVAQALERSRARVLVVADSFRGRDHAAEAAAVLAGGGTAVEHVLVVGLDGEASALPAGWRRLDEALPASRVDADALAARTPAPDARAQLLFTSGTTGEPKGVVHRFDALTRAAAMEIEHLGLGRDDRVFVPSPLAHQTGFLYGMWLAWFLGSPQILLRQWDAERALAALRDWDGTFVQAATPFLADLVAAVSDGAKAPPLRVFVVTGAAVPRVLAARATEVLGTAVCGAWGSTETCLGTLGGPDDPPEKAWGTDGRPLAGVEVRIVDDAGRVLRPGREGNFELRSRCFFEGYLDRPEWTAEALTPDGWFRTGDLATLDADGYLRVTGRVKDVINRGGEKVPVAEIEQLLHGHPAVAEAAIVAMPDDRLGERACAFVVLREGGQLDFAGMQRHLDAAGVAKPYWPERLELVPELPRNPVGKVQKFRLRERAQLLSPHVTQEAVP